MKRILNRSFLLMLLFVPMLFRADYVVDGARRGLLLWYQSVVPALFPFMVLNSLVSSGDGLTALMTPFYRILHPLFGLSRHGCYVLLSGLLCGCPMGAKICAEFVRDGKLTISEGQMLLAICNHASPMFILGYAYSYFSGTVSMSEFLLCMYLPVPVLAVAARMVYGRKNQSTFHADQKGMNQHGVMRPGQSSLPAPKTPSIDDTILASVEILCKIGGYLVMFSVGIVFLCHETRIPAAIRLPLIGALEMTTGIHELAAALPRKTAFPAAMAALAFGGFSGLFQTRSVLELQNPTSETAAFRPSTERSASGGRSSSHEKKTGLSIRSYFFWKLAHAALSALMAIGICKSL